MLLRSGADPSIRNLENDQPAHLLQSGVQGDQVSCPNILTASQSHTVLLFQFLSRVIHYHPVISFSFLAQAHAEETKCFLSSTYRVLAGPGMIKITCNPHLVGISL